VIIENGWINDAFPNYLGKLVFDQIQLQLEGTLEKVFESYMRSALPSLAVFTPLESVRKLDYLPIDAEFECKLFSVGSRLFQ
jgi:hypothetical protein